MTGLEAARAELAATLGPEAVLSDPLALKLYARDASWVYGWAGLVALPGFQAGVVV